MLVLMFAIGRYSAVNIDFCSWRAGVSIIGRNLSNMDAKYNTLFNDLAWRDNVFERYEFNNRFNQSMGLKLLPVTFLKYLNFLKFGI